MPTAVEFIANILRNALKLDAIDSPYALRQFSALDDEIDPGFRALNAAETARAFAAAEHQYGRVFQSLGDGSVALGFDLQRDAVDNPRILRIFAEADREVVDIENDVGHVSALHRHCEEPTGPAFWPPDDRLRDEAIHFSLRQIWIASLRSQ